METIHYLVKVSACIACFYIVYLVLFRNCAAFALNRTFLLAGIIMSFLIPSLDLSFIPADFHVDASGVLSTFSVGEISFEPSKNIAAVTATDFQLPSLIYWAGVLIFGMRLLYGVWKIFDLMRSSEISTIGSIKVFKSNVDQPFSFFNTIFLPQGDVETVVIDHERNHVIKYHWVDLLIAETTCIILWFNPVVIFYKRSLKIQHEYEADAGALSSGIKIEKYLDCILQHLQARSAGKFISSFYSQNIKQRILMMTKNKTSQNYNLLYLIFIPMVFGLLSAFSSAPIRTNDVFQALTTTDPNETIILIDPGHGGTDAGSTAHQSNEKDIALSFAQAVRAEGEKRGLKIILTRSGDQVLSLDERLSIVQRMKAKIFLSIHVNYDNADVSRSGIDIIVSDKNKEVEKSNRIAEQLRKELDLLGNLKVNGVKNADYYILSRNSIPATLIELGYLSNKADHAFLSDEKNLQAVSERIINAVVASLK
jgi:N-acetylmuramoyl-L-alanine amidase